MPFGKSKEPKAPKEKKEKKPKPAKKAKPPKKEKPPKKQKPQKKPKPAKKPKKGQQPPVEPVEGEELEQEQEQGKKKKPIILLLIPIVLIAAAAVVVFLFVLPHRETSDDPATVETEEPKPPELPEELMVGEESVPGMTLEADESGAQAVLAKTITYTYTNLNDAGKAAETYVGQLRGADPGFSIVDEDFVRLTEKPDFTTAEGMVLMARNLPKPESEAEATPAPTEAPEDESASPEEGSAPPEASEDVSSPAPEESAEPANEAPDMVLTVRITWSEGQCVVTADEVEGKVTSPPPSQNGVPGTPSIGVREAEDQLKAMTPAELGLSGTSMADYEVISQNGIEMVDGENCVRVDVYNGSTGPTPYEFEGTYLMSVNGAHLYWLNPQTNELEELEFTLKP